MQHKLHCDCCDKDYWPNAAWQHKDCLVVNKPELVVNMVVNADPMVVNKSRTKDRHRDKDKRREYMREYMKRKRKRNV